jgi:4-hydroxy-4-methyl-2-oxoglutarate aldolase
MIDDPPLITLRRPSRRPSSDQVAALNGVPTGFVVDALGGRGALPAAIKPVVPEQSVFCGVALTCDAGPADNLAVFAALPWLQPGDVIVAVTGGFLETAITGDLLIGMVRNCGVVGFVTDGSVRDVAGIRAVGVPCFAAGVTPNSPARNGPGRVGLPVTLGGTVIESGDVVLGDPDGVVVIPFGQVDAVIARLAAVRAAEAALDAKVKAGLRVPDFVAVVLDGRVHEVE